MTRDLDPMSIRSMKMAKRVKQFVFVIAIAFIVVLDLGMISFMSKDREQLSTTQADALFGGEAELRAYPYAGYIIDYSGVFTRQVCGITYISQNIGVSAAHCFEDEGLYFAGYGIFRPEPIYNVPIEKYQFDEKWDFETLSGDIAVVSFAEDEIDIDQYAQIATPAVGCGYEVLAYGSTDQDVLSNADLRRKADVCIENVTTERFYLTSKEGGICFGDSGSPIFVKDTNKIVGIVSAITADQNKYSEENCFVNNKAVATRLDSSLSFISSSQQPLIATSSCPLNSDQLCDEDEKCRSNKCRKPSDYAYSSAVDYRSVDFIFGDYLGTALLVVSGFLTFVFILVIYRSFTRSYG